MTQFNDRVEKQRLKIEAEEWAQGVRSLHAHSLTSLSYDNGREDGSVLDIQYNDGRVERKIDSTGETIILGTQLIGKDLVEQYVRESH
tara:strand:- start:258 stop:521 length:264 start_codon:yes stop_codon:yes gene_type:complete